MTITPRIVLVFACFASTQCTAPPGQTHTAAAEPIAEPVAAPAPSVARADALLEDMRRREEAYAEAERNAPPPPPPPRLEDFTPRAEPAPETRAVTVAANAPPLPTPVMALSTPAAAQSEEFWKNRMRDAQARLDAAQLALVAASAQVREVERYVRPDGKMSSVIADNLLRAQESETRAAAAAVFERRQIENLQEEARRAGIPPGWLRP